MSEPGEDRPPGTAARERLFGEVLDAHDRSLRRIARAYAGPTGEDQDLHQEMLCQLWRSLPSFRGDSALGTWVYRVALNTALTHRRRARRRRHVEADGQLADERQGATAGEPKEEAALLGEFLKSLGTVDRSVLVLYLEGLAHRQIADVTGQSQGAVAVRLHRLKQAFTRRYLER